MRTIEVNGINIVNLFQDETGREGVTPSYYRFKQAKDLKKGEPLGRGIITDVQIRDHFVDIAIRYDDEVPVLTEYAWFDDDEWVHPESGDSYDVDENGYIL